MNRGILVILLVLMGASVTSCRRQAVGYRVHFILPDDYRGVFTIVADSTNGISVNAVSNVLTCRVPKTGVLSVRMFEPFTVPHEESAAFANGKLLEMGSHQSSNISSGTIACRSLGMITYPRRAIAYVIGTESEVDPAYDSLRFRKK